MARDWKFQIKEVKGLYYPCSENKVPDQLRGYCEADLRLCFCICKAGFFMTRLIVYLMIVFSGCGNCFRKWEDRFSSDNAHFIKHIMSFRDFTLFCDSFCIKSNMKLTFVN